MTNLDVVVEHPLQALRPGHRGTAFGGGAVCWLVQCRGLVARAPFGRRHVRALAAVGRKHPVVADQVGPRRWYQGREAGQEVERAAQK
jgi:hypothetical protein